jgi:hypothetical protein
MKTCFLIIFVSAALIAVLFSGGARADVIYLEDGRVIEGDIVEKGDDVIKVKTGAGIVMPINRADIVKIATREELIKEYDAQLKKVGDKNSDGHMALADWCKKNGLRDKYRVELDAALKADPNNEEAKREITRLDGKTGLDGADSSAPEKKSDTGAKPESAAPKEDDKSAAKPVVSKDEKKKSAPVKKKTPAAAAAYDKACKYLAQMQDARGNWAKEDYNTDEEVVRVSFATLALMSTGSTSSEGPYKDNVKRAVDWLVKKATEKPVYCAGIKFTPKDNWRWSTAAMALAEAYADTRDNAVGMKLQELVAALENSQETTGGYGHYHGKCENNYTELAVVCNWATASLGMAKELGLNVNNEKYKSAIEYIWMCSKGGPMRYSHVNGANPCPGRTGGGMFALAMCGRRKTQHFEDMAAFVTKSIARVERGHASPTMHFLQAGLGCIQHSQKMWDLFVANNFQKIIANQTGDGSFRPMKNPEEDLGAETTQGTGPIYVTGLLALTLGLDEGGLHFMSGVYATDPAEPVGPSK